MLLEQNVESFLSLNDLISIPNDDDEDEEDDEEDEDKDHPMDADEDEDAVPPVPRVPRTNGVA